MGEKVYGRQLLRHNEFLKNVGGIAIGGLKREVMAEKVLTDDMKNRFPLQEVILIATHGIVVQAPKRHTGAGRAFVFVKAQNEDRAQAYLAHGMDKVYGKMKMFSRNIN